MHLSEIDPLIHNNNMFHRGLGQKDGLILLFCRNIFAKRGSFNPSQMVENVFYTLTTAVETLSRKVQNLH